LVLTALSRLPNGSLRHARLWFRVALSVRELVPQDGSNCHGGVQVTTRHTIGPTHRTFWWHCP
jgi:hypothetical protein